MRIVALFILVSFSLSVFAREETNHYLPRKDQVAGELTGMFATFFSGFFACLPLAKSPEHQNKFVGFPVGLLFGGVFGMVFGVVISGALFGVDGIGGIAYFPSVVSGTVTKAAAFAYGLVLPFFIVLISKLKLRKN